MFTHRPTGWNTWDFRGFNRLVYLSRGKTQLAVQYAIWDEHVPPPTADSRRVGRLYDTFRWQDVTRLGPHGDVGLPADIEFKAGDMLWRAEADDLDGVLELAVAPLGETRQRVVFLFVAPEGEAADYADPDEGRFAGADVEFEEAGWPSHYFLNLGVPYAVGEPGTPALVRVSPGRAARGTRAGSAESARGGRAAEGPRIVPDAGRPPLTGAGALAEVEHAMFPAVTWNTLYDSRRRLVCSPVSRDWCADWHGPVVFCWDTYLVGALLSVAHPELSRMNFEAVTAAVDELDFVPNYYMAHGATSLDRSMPPIGTYLIWKAQAAAPDRKWLRKLYPKLKRWHGFWKRYRSASDTGLLSWGSNAEPEYEFPQLVPFNPTLRHSAQAAKWESGLDNSPMYDDVPFNPRTNTLELDDVGLSSYYAMDCEALARIADCLNRSGDAETFRAEHAEMAARINTHLWDDRDGIYRNRHWDGRLSQRVSPTSFFTLIAGVAPTDRAQRLIHEHLLDEQAFWGTFVIPSIARRDPAFADNDYWRGRIWGPFNYLVAEGLRRYRFDDTAAELAEKSLELLMRNWRTDGGVYENYNAETGQGGDVWNAARLYHWGGLLGLIAINELIDVEPTGMLRFGSLVFPDAHVREARIGDSVYTVELQNGLRVIRDNNPIIECTERAIVRLPLDKSAPIEVAAARPATLRLAELPHRRVRVNGGAAEVTGSDGSFRWDVPSAQSAP